MKEFLSEAKNLFEKDFLQSINLHGDIEPINEAVKYSLVGGKRIRPILVMLGAEFMQSTYDNLKYLASGIECIHNYSLVHDDMPCMDNDTLRHGKACTHVKFGEDMGLLAGDALLNLAFQTMLCAKVMDDKYIKAVKYISDMSGIDGMIGGQCLDLADKSNGLSLDEIIRLNRLKTSCLFKAALAGGAMACGANEEEIGDLEFYADALGLIFQIVDDLLDLESTVEDLGKDIGSDERENKVTYISLVGKEKAREDILKFEREVANRMDKYGNRAEKLIKLMKYLSSRSY